MKKFFAQILCVLAFFVMHKAAAFSSLEIVEGIWELDPSETDDVQNFKCDATPLQIDIDPENLRYASTIDGATEYADILEVGETYFWLRYDGEIRLDDDGHPLEWALVLADDDHFYWLRRDWVAKGHGSRTAMRRRCPSPDQIS